MSEDQPYYYHGCPARPGGKRHAMLNTAMAMLKPGQRLLVAHLNPKDNIIITHTGNQLPAPESLPDDQ